MTKLTYSTSDVSAVLQQPQSYVLDLISHGQIRTRKCLSGACTILRNDLLSFMRQNNLSTSALEKQNTVLILNDNLALKEEIDRFYDTMAHGYEIVAITNGYEAVINLLQKKPDLLIINTQSKCFYLPGIFKALKKTACPPAVVILTGEGDGDKLEINIKGIKSFDLNCLDKLFIYLQNFN